MSKPKAPQPPDYVGAAQAQGQSNKEAAVASSILSNPNIVNPYGSQTVTYNKLDNGELQPTVTQSLSPEQQKLYEQQTQLSTGMNQLGLQGLDVAGNVIGQQFDPSGLPARSINPGQTGQDAIMSRLNPQLNMERDQLQTQLANQGIDPNSEAYHNAMREQNQRENDLYTQAAMYGIQTGDQARQQALNEQLQLRELPLNEVNSLRTGNSVNLPSAGYTGSQINPADIYGALSQQGQAQLGQYNADLARTSSQNQSIGGAASLAAMLYMMSDRRLKRNIKRIGRTNKGIEIYSYEYINGVKSIGPMADEVEKIIPEAVIDINGYKAVNYSMIGEL